MLDRAEVCSTNVNTIFVLRSETARAESNAVEEAGGGPWLEPEKSVASKTDVGQVVSTATGARHSTGVGWSLAHLKLVMFPGHQFVKCFSVTHGHCGMTCSDLSLHSLSLGIAPCAKFFVNSPRGRWHKDSRSPLPCFFLDAPEGLLRLSNGLEGPSP